VACTVLVFRQDFALEDAIGSHACSLEANMCVTNSIPLGCQLPLTVANVNFVETRKVYYRRNQSWPVERGLLTSAKQMPRGG
jgi:hypothetical protein